jgi:hypothetical protein
MTKAYQSSGPSGASRAECSGDAPCSGDTPAKTMPVMNRAKLECMRRTGGAMATLRALGVQLAAPCALGLTPLTGHGGLDVTSPAGTDRLHRGDPIAVEFKLDADTLLDTFQFTPDYQSFANILRLTANPTIAADIASGIGFCTPGACSFFYLPAKSIPKGTVAAQWSFRVMDDAPIGPFAFDLQLFVNQCGSGTCDLAEPARRLGCAVRAWRKATRWKVEQRANQYDVAAIRDGNAALI